MAAEGVSVWALQGATLAHRWGLCCLLPDSTDSHKAWRPGTKLCGKLRANLTIMFRYCDFRRSSYRGELGLLLMWRPHSSAPRHQLACPFTVNANFWAVYCLPFLFDFRFNFMWPCVWISVFVYLFLSLSLSLPVFILSIFLSPISSYLFHILPSSRLPSGCLPKHLDRLP